MHCSRSLYRRQIAEVQKTKKIYFKILFFTYNSCFVFKVVFHFVVLAVFVVVVVFTSTIILFFVSFSVFYHQKNFNLLHIICCCCFSLTVFLFYCFICFVNVEQSVLNFTRYSFCCRTRRHTVQATCTFKSHAANCAQRDKRQRGNCCYCCRQRRRRQRQRRGDCDSDCD